jgi:hypothetical protein
MVLIGHLRWLNHKLSDFLRKAQAHNDNQKQQLFVDMCQPQSEEDFLIICHAQKSLEKRKVALSIRRVIAHLGETESTLIHAEMTFEDLDLLPFWKNCGDAGFNTFTFANAIASDLDFLLTDQLALSYPGRDPDLNLNMKIYEFINEFYEWYLTVLT